MKFSIDAKELAQGLGAVGKAVSARPTHPVLGCVLVKVGEGTVVLTGFDLSLGIEVMLPASGTVAGAIAIPAKIFTEIVSKVDGVLHIVVSKYKDTCSIATIKYDSGEIKINCLESQDFPALPEVDGDLLSVPADALQEGIRLTAFAASTEETKQILTGIHIKGGDGNLEFAATDGHRLAKAVVPIEGSLEFAITLPGRALRGLEKLLDGETINFAADETQAVFESDSTKLTCRVLGGAYPAYNQLFPAQFARTVIVRRKRLLTALDRVSVLSSEKDNLLQVNIRESDMVVSVESQDVGNGTDLVPADAVGGALDVGFNTKYLREGLAAMSADEVRINLNEPTQPVVVNPIDGGDYSYLVMPVKLVN
jgi:DNA polymerase-3 subunit beta